MDSFEFGHWLAVFKMFPPTLDGVAFTWEKQEQAKSPQAIATALFNALQSVKGRQK